MNTAESGVVNFYTVLHAVCFGGTRGFLFFDYSKDEHLLGLYEQNKNFISVPEFTQEKITELKRLWSTTKTLRADTGMEVFEDIAKCVQHDVSHYHEDSETQKLLSLWGLTKMYGGEVSTVWQETDIFPRFRDL